MLPSGEVRWGLRSYRYRGFHERKGKLHERDRGKDRQACRDEEAFAAAPPRRGGLPRRARRFLSRRSRRLIPAPGGNTFSGNSGWGTVIGIARGTGGLPWFRKLRSREIRATAHPRVRRQGSRGFRSRGIPGFCARCGGTGRLHRLGINGDGRTTSPARCDGSSHENLAPPDMMNGLANRTDYLHIRLHLLGLPSGNRKNHCARPGFRNRLRPGWRFPAPTRPDDRARDPASSLGPGHRSCRRGVTAACREHMLHMIDSADLSSTGSAPGLKRSIGFDDLERSKALLRARPKAGSSKWVRRIKYVWIISEKTWSVIKLFVQ